MLSRPKPSLFSMHAETLTLESVAAIAVAVIQPKILKIIVNHDIVHAMCVIHGFYL